jgi:hypothetical protein
MRTYDFDRNGLISPEHCRHALKQVKMVCTREVDEAIKSSMRESWGGGDLLVDYPTLIKKIARDPPGQIR